MGGQSLWGDGQSQVQGECATRSGERETQELTKYQGMNGSQWNDGGAWERRGPDLRGSEGSVGERYPDWRK